MFTHFRASALVLSMATVVAARADDHSDHCTEATPVAGGSFSGRIDSTTDFDWFAVPTTSGHFYRLQSAGILRWSMYSPDCATQIGPTTYRGLASSGSLVASGTELRVVVGPGGAGQAYSFVVTDEGAVTDDHSNNRSSGTELSPGAAPTPARIDYRYDEDWFYVRVNQDEVLDLELFLDRPGMWLNWYIGIGDTEIAAGTSPDQIPAGPWPASLTHRIAVPSGLAGVMWLRLSMNIYPDDAPDLPVPADYRVQITRSGFVPHPDDAGDDCETAAAIGAGQGARVWAIGQARDADYFRVAVTPAHRYIVTVRTVTEGQYLECKVLDSGCSIPLATATAREPQYPVTMEFTAPPDGVAYVRVVGGDRVVPPTGLYEVSVQEQPGGSDDHGGNPATATPLVADWIDGTIDGPADEDWFRVSVPEQSVLRIDAAPLTRGTYFTHELFRPGGAIPDGGSAFVWSPGLTPPPPMTYRRVVPAGAAGEWYIAVQSYDPGAYRLSARVERSLVGTPHSPSCDTARAIAVGSPEGCVIMGPADQDWLQFPVLAGRRYRMLTEESVGGAPSVAIHFPDCTTRLRREDGVNVSVMREFVPATSGIARVRYGTSATRPNLAWFATALDFGPVLNDAPPVAAGSPQMSPGGRILAGRVDFFGDLDVVRARLRGGVTYRLEARAQLLPLQDSADVLCRFGMTAATTLISLRPNLGSNDGYSPWVGAEFRWDQGDAEFLLQVSEVSGILQPAEFPPRYELRIYRPGCRGDWNGSGEVGFDDLAAYLADYFGDPVAAEFDGLGSRAEVSDLFGFVTAWLSGCP